MESNSIFFLVRTERIHELQAHCHFGAQIEHFCTLFQLQVSIACNLFPVIYYNTNKSLVKLLSAITPRPFKNFACPFFLTEIQGVLLIVIKENKLKYKQMTCTKVKF